MSHTLKLPPVALGLRAHSGWAALVAVAGSRQKPTVVDRRRLQTADPAIPGSKQPYHAAEKWDLKKAADYLRRCTTSSRRLARQALRSALNDLSRRGHQVVGCGILLGSGDTPPSLAAVLASHPRIHAAEGWLFREVLIHASRRCRLPAIAVKERELLAHAAARLRLPPQKLQRRIVEMGQGLGPPWTQDQKLAALVGWLALAAPSRRSARKGR